jgi:hypothetical protein
LLCNLLLIKVSFSIYNKELLKPYTSNFLYWKMARGQDSVTRDPTHTNQAVSRSSALSSRSPQAFPILQCRDPKMLLTKFDTELREKPESLFYRRRSIFMLSSSSFCTIFIKQIHHKPPSYCIRAFLIEDFMKIKRYELSKKHKLNYFINRVCSNKTLLYD